LLREQNGSLFSLSSLRGKVVVLTFLDPVSTLGSPVIAQELRQSSTLLGSQSGRVEFVAVVANSQYRSAAALQAFDRAEGLADMSNWLYLTGPVRHLMAAWKAYGVDSRLSAWGPMIPGAYRVFVIDATGWEQYQLNADPWPSDEASQASFAAVLAATVQQVLTTQ
jgi:cytochrome oxidase Cu insertion factor (SCO1/SenC/PrrC family)